MGTATFIGFIILLVVLLIFSAIFSAAEVSYMSVSKLLIEKNLKHHKLSAKLIRKHYNHYGWTLATILISNNLVNLATSSLATYLIAEQLDNSEYTALISTAVVTPIVVIFGEIVPKLVAKRHPYPYLVVVVYLIEALNWVFFPFTFPLSRIALSVRVTNTETDLKELLNIASKEGVLEKHEATLAQRALDLDSQQVEQIMTRLKNIQWVESTATIDEAKKIFVHSAYSRIPVRSKNKFVGVVILKDILVAPESDRIVNYMKDPVYVSRNIIVAKALEEMRTHKSQMALVTETRKSTQVIGLITIEDITESLFGEIHDEHDDEEIVRQIAHDKWAVQEEVKLSVISSFTEINFGVKADVSIKAWLQDQTGRRLKLGMTYNFRSKYVFKVIKNDRKTGAIVQIFKKE